MGDPRYHNSLVSIITCVYNGELYISRLLDSVLASGYPSIEHIIVNDGSSDNTVSLLKTYVPKYRKVYGDGSLVIINQQNQGLGAATNVALKLIKGDFWTWINCDDWYMPRFFQKTVHYLATHPRVDFVQIPAIEYELNETGIVRSKFDPKPIRWSSYQGESLKRRLYRNSLTFFHYLVKTEKYKSINPTMSICPSRKTQDVQLAAQIFGFLKGGILRERLICYLARPDSLMAKNPNSGMSELELVSQSIALLDISENAKSQELSLYRAGEAMNSIVAALSRGDKAAFRRAYSVFKQFVTLKKLKYVIPRPRFIFWCIILLWRI